MSKAITSVLIAAGLVALALVLNPSADKHREKIKQVIAERSELERALGLGHLTAFTSRYHSVGVASYTSVGDSTTSVGAFGMVFVLE